MAAPTIGELVRHGGVHALYQTIVDLQTGEVVAYEALAGGPAGSGLESPDRLFGAGRRAGLLAELDWPRPGRRRSRRRASLPVRITHERSRVLTAARRLMTEVVPAPAGEPLVS